MGAMKALAIDFAVSEETKKAAASELFDALSEILGDEEFWNSYASHHLPGDEWRRRGIICSNALAALSKAGRCYD